MQVTCQPRPSPSDLPMAADTGTLRALPVAARRRATEGATMTTESDGAPHPPGDERTGSLGELPGTSGL
ncbi:MAG TPA: hypothetical protein VFY89_01025, partial [Ktedonobacterales bacterium]